MFNARVFFTASVMTLFLYPMTAMAADVSPPTSGADAEGNLPNVFQRMYRTKGCYND